MDSIMVPVEFVDIGERMAIVFVFFCIITHIFSDKFDELFFPLIKAFFYGFLAINIQKYIIIQGIEQIGILTAFTGIFCFLECGDNLLKMILIFIDILKMIVKAFINEK